MRNSRRFIFLVVFVMSLSQVLACEHTGGKGCESCGGHAKKSDPRKPANTIPEPPLNDGEIFSLLIPYSKEKKATRFEFFHVNCGTNTDGKARCHMSVDSTDKVIVRLSADDSEKLFLDILARLPIAKGDSGAETSYVGCSTWQENGTPNYQCHVAVPVQNVPHDRVPTN